MAKSLGIQMVEVTPKKDPAGKIEWTMCVGTTCGDKSNFPDVSLSQKKAYVLVFNINDPDNTQVGFSSDPIWIAKSGNAKPNKVIGPTDEISDVTLSNNDKTLAFIDLNKGKMDLTYQLNFVDPNGAVTAIDPVIKNGGGSGYQYFTQTALIGLVVGVCFALAISFLIGKRMAR